MTFFTAGRALSRQRRARSRLARWSILAGLLFGLGLQNQTQAQMPPAAPLSVHDAVKAATAHALSPLAAEAGARAAREMAVAAAQRPDPVLRLSIDNLPVNGPARYSLTRDFMTMRSIGLAQSFTREDKRQARSERYERQALSALAERQVRVAWVQRETALAWFNRRAAEQRLALLSAQRDESRLQIEAADAALRGGRGGSAAALAARDALAQLEQSLLGADAEAANARRTLARWTGGPPAQPLADAPALGQAAWPTHAVLTRLDQHPQLQKLAADEAQALAAVAVARAEREPDWSAQLMFSQRGSRYSDMLTFAVSLPLPWDRPQRQDRELAARLAQAEALRAERDELAREHLALTESWVEAWQAGLARLALIDRERSPLALQRVDAALAAYRGGQSALDGVLQARRAALALQRERIDIELETAQLWARLAFLIPESDHPPLPAAASVTTKE